jgi:hypothetical protein
MTTWVLRGCAVLMTAMMFIASWNGFVENGRFNSVGEKAVVQPIKEYTETTTTKTKLGVQVSESKTKSALLTFTTKDRQAITVNRNLPDEIFAKLAAHEPVYIEYLPDSPTTTRFEGDTAWPLLNALLGLIGTAATYFLWNGMQGKQARP